MSEQDDDASEIDLSAFTGTESKEQPTEGDPEENDQGEELDMTFTALKQFKDNDIGDDTELKTTARPSENEKLTKEKEPASEVDNELPPSEQPESEDTNFTSSGLDGVEHLPAESNNPILNEKPDDFTPETGLSLNGDSADISSNKANPMDDLVDNDLISQDIHASEKSEQISGASSTSLELDDENTSIEQNTNGESNISAMSQSLHLQTETSVNLAGVLGTEEVKDLDNSDYTSSNIQIPPESQLSPAHNPIDNSKNLIETLPEENYEDFAITQSFKNAKTESIKPGEAIGDVFKEDDQNFSPPKDFENINTFGTPKSPNGNLTTPIQFSILIKDVNYIDEVQKIQDILSNSKLGLDNSSLRKQIETGQALIQGINEYSAIFIARNLRVIGANFLFGPSTEIDQLAGDIMKNPPKNPVSKQDLDFRSTDSVSFKKLPLKYSDIILTTSDTVPGESIAQYRGVVVSSRLVPSDTAPEVALDNFSDYLLGKIRQKALYKQANAVIGANVSIQTAHSTSQEEKDNAQYHVIAIGTAVRLT